MNIANELRKNQVPHEKVTWIIDRNVNTTNVCIANCKFCNFYRIPGHAEAYITDIETYKRKIDETFRYGGEQLLLQGGHHPDLGLAYYVDTFSQLKKLYPALKLHALGPPEVAHITKLEKSTHKEVLSALKAAGLDSLPGPGAEILVDRVRRLISKGKCGSDEWLAIMEQAHQLDLTTSATMMFPRCTGKEAGTCQRVYCIYPMDFPGCRYFAGPYPGRSKPGYRGRIHPHDCHEPYHATQY
jgi:cyclic dehypoxanthinyl futalosine synthase